MADIVTIWNMAIARCAISGTIESLEERSKLAGVCRSHYEQARDLALEEFPWKFARRRVVLADLGTPPSTWSFCYAYPSDCVFALALVQPGLRNPRWDQRPPFEVAATADQTVIYSDLEQAELIYTARVEDPNRYDAHFVNVVAWALAELIAIPITAKPEVVTAARQGYESAKSKAAAKGLAEGWDGPEPECEFLTGRR